MIQQVSQAYKRIKIMDINGLLYVSIFILFCGFLLNGCIFEICESISYDLYKIADKLLFILEGIIIAITLLILFFRKPIRIIIVYAISGIIFLLSFLVFPQNKEAILSILKNFFLYGLTSLILPWEICNDKNLYKKILNISKITFFFSLLYLMILMAKGEGIYNLWLSSYFFFAAIFNLYDAYKNRRSSSIIIGILSFITLFSTGSRTYLMLYISFAILLLAIILVRKICAMNSKKKIIAISIILLALVLLTVICINYKKICNELFYLLKDKGIEIRILRLLATGNFFISNDRINVMYPTITQIISKNWLWGLGIGGDRNLLYNMYLNNGTVRPDAGIEAYYSHNILLEIYSNFGIVIGTVLIALLIYGLYKVMLCRKNREIAICLTIVSIFPLMLTGTFWDNVYFWGLVGVICANYLKKNKDNEQIIDKQKDNVIMLLDNAFEPDVRVYKEAKYLVEQKKNVEIVCLDKKNKYKDRETEEFDGIKIKRIFCRTEKTTNKIENSKIIAKCKGIIYFWWLLKFIRQAKRYLKNKDFEILHCHDLVMASVGCIFFSDKKIVFDMHEYYGNKNNRFKDIIIKKLVHYTQNRSNWIIYVNDFQKQNCKCKNYNKLIELPNYPDRKKFEDINKTESDKIRISYIGKVRDFYSLSKLIDYYSNDNNLIEVKIYGDGSPYVDLLEYAKRKNKSEIMQGPYNGLADLQTIYKNTDIVYSVYDVMSATGNNWRNAMPVKSFESVLTLTPIIASKNTVLGNFVEKNDVGFTVDIHDKNELNNLFDEIKNNPILLKNKIENLKKIQYIYIWENVVTNLDRIYKTQ